ncbi:hydrogenase maturation protein [Solemya velesiana gill symbiont]|uniref:Hydrogenase maturation protein n=1 Tax=Solemya velesiana gill symbiont TaxID=1918948 RepID=A0A1T2KTE2_9GAMM|nr:hydrogenase maturation protein [Solemya velesiana gill symbiont]OOZ36000.1 hydrogenase maturation protein [Solemya velesiana gill symbiont]
MGILFLCHSFNSLTQRLYVELSERGHEVSVEFDVNDEVTQEAVDLFEPELIIAPFLKRAIPEAVWRNHVCLVVHPGIRGDRGPSALDWAILNGETRWGVTLLQANEEMDAGDIWASVEFPMRDATKASLYRNEVTEAAVEAVLAAVARLGDDAFTPEPLDYAKPDVQGQLRSLMQQSDRSIDWQHDDTVTVLSKVRCADGFPGVKDRIGDRELFLYDARQEHELTGSAGELIARSGPAVCRATKDGAVWIGHMRDPMGEHPFKLPAVEVLKSEISGLSEVEATPSSGYRDIWYEEDNGVGYLHFSFYNGAMGTEQCERLRQAFIAARERETRVIVLVGGPDYWSNGMHLNLIESAESTADESWNNINAIDDLAREIITTKSHITVSALCGNAGAGGVFLARAADRVWARSGVILNPHYKDMGNLYGSEYWTYLMSKNAGEENTRRISQGRLPMGAAEAQELGLIDGRFEVGPQLFPQQVREEAERLAQHAGFDQLLQGKRKNRQQDEETKRLESYRQQELEKMHLNFYGFDPSYHVARYNFVYKVPKSRTPLTIAKHRRVSKLRDAS